jgi:selenocysteine lyase/cysteine desulfurase
MMLQSLLVKVMPLERTFSRLGAIRPFSGYQSIGSFHSENLAEIMATPAEEYQPPPLPFDDETVVTINSDPSFDFGLDLEHWTFLNHGAFGAALKIGSQHAAAWSRFAEQQPLRYFDRHLLPHLAYSARLLADMIHAPYTHVALLPNVTAGMNSIIAGYARMRNKQDAHILLWDTTYASTKKMARHYARVTEIPFQANYFNQLATVDGDPDEVWARALTDSLVNMDSSSPILVILDHTTSNTALTVPVERLAKLIKSTLPNAVVLVDGAHGLLAQHVNVQAMPSIDYYVTSGHKWLSAPRGVAILYAKSNDASSELVPAVLSHGMNEPDLFSRFVWDGCRDYTAALAVPVVMDYWNQRGVASVRNMQKTTLHNGIEILIDTWHSKNLNSDLHLWPDSATLTRIDSSVLSPMALVRLPDRFRGSSSDAKRVQDLLYNQQIEAPIKCINEKLYTRVSSHIYNKARDFERLATAVAAM